MSGTLKELRAHLVAAKTALSAGNLAAARESCKSALRVDDNLTRLGRSTARW